LSYCDDLCLGTAFFGCGKETAKEFDTVTKLYVEMDAVLGRPFKRMEPPVVSPTQLFDKELYMIPLCDPDVVLAPPNYLVFLLLQ
jgi:hypothetical protein